MGVELVTNEHVESVHKHAHVDQEQDALQYSRDPAQRG